MKPSPKRTGIKYIKVKDNFLLKLGIETMILQFSNAGLISLQLDREVGKFIKSLADISLSEEFQTYSLPTPRKKK